MWTRHLQYIQTSEVVGADDVATQILWTKHFMEAQGYMIEDNILHQDNKSTILLQENGRKSAGKRSRELKCEILFSYGPSREREPKDNLLSH